MAENGSPRAIFETTDDRLTFLVTIPVHEGCNNSSLHGKAAKPSAKKSSGTQLESSGTCSGTDVTSSGTRQKTSEKIIELINADPQITAPKIAMELCISTRGVEKESSSIKGSRYSEANWFSNVWWLLGNNNERRQIKLI